MNELLVSVHTLINQSGSWALLGSFAWGLASILLSPCHLASIPLLMAYVSGQQEVFNARKGTGCACLFALGLFASIALIGLICAAAGRLLGDVPPLLVALVGVMLIALGLDLGQFVQWRLPQLHVSLKPRGCIGAFVLGASYGIFSGACTFGFLAPVLASAGLQSSMFAGWLLVAVFALGHCLPIVLAGSAAALTCRLLSSKKFTKAAACGRRAAGVVVMLIGLYFTATAAAEL